MSGSVCFAGLMCHAPIVHPAVGGAQSALCQRTTRAMREVAARAVAAQPDRIVLISPHSPRREREWGAWIGPIRGDLGQFRAPQVAVDLPGAPEVAAALALPPIPLPGRPRPPLDHGAMVPLAFLYEAGWRGPTAVLALPWEDPDSEALGRAIAQIPGRTAVIASGDMSHKLIRGAPAGYDPRARQFDAAFVAALRRRDWAAIPRVEPRELAAEDVVDSTRVALAAVPGPLHDEVLSYEGPWGVGYAEAILYDPRPPLYATARQAVRAAASGERFQPADDDTPAAGVFVTLWKGDDLRGCIGSVKPTCASLRAEVARSARLAALEDPRFPAVTPAEVDELAFEVSVLQPPEPARGEEDLDPEKWGVIVSSGWRRGLLLPNVDGVSTAREQVAIARRKAGISPGEPVELQRFAVRKEASP